MTIVAAAVQLVDLIDSILHSLNIHDDSITIVVLFLRSIQRKRIVTRFRTLVRSRPSSLRQQVHRPLLQAGNRFACSAC